MNKPGRNSTGGSQKDRSLWEESRAQELITQVLNKELSLTAAAVRLGVDTNTFFAHLTDNGKNKARVALLMGSPLSLDDAEMDDNPLSIGDDGREPVEVLNGDRDIDDDRDLGMEDEDEIAMNIRPEVMVREHSELIMNRVKVEDDEVEVQDEDIPSDEHDDVSIEKAEAMMEENHKMNDTDGEEEDQMHEQNQIHEQDRLQEQEDMIEPPDGEAIDGDENEEMNDMQEFEPPPPPPAVSEGEAAVAN